MKINYIDDDFDVYNKMFYWTGNFYDDADFLESKMKANNKVKIIDITNKNKPEGINFTENEKQLYLNKNLFLKNEILEFIFNEVNNKQKSLNINKDAFKRIGINKF